ncbi:cytochrome P450 [Streptosporangium lutulentum]|uniref:Cytochrome P450 n=1 Tax=Streptosporangium lutulentum TaxID=1461250 RepID=A0ABT9Q3K1_9ACTN|nr:cytochrome P450 [Streptosporangium lutulentum]MDP9841315.1 cytochrome P450 [Streptosporangium lutulentum]
MAQTGAFEQILDYSNRADPYPLYAELRKTPVARQSDGTYVVSTYKEIVALLHDPRVSSDPRGIPELTAVGAAPGEETPELPPAFIRLDPPGHDRLRCTAMRHFGPPGTPGRVDGMAPRMAEIVTDLIDGFDGGNRADIVDDFAYPLPVTVICELLGVPREDDRLFHRWSQTIIEANDQTTGPLPERQRRRFSATAELGRYLKGLVGAHRRHPGDDLLSALALDADMPSDDLLSTAALLLIAGHETTVNLIANGVLTLLRRPELLERLRHEPDLVIGTVEELLRYDPPVQALATGRNVLSDIDLAGTTIPRGSVVTLLLASGSRDPERFHDPDRFDPDRQDNQHLGFGGGIHYCFGAPLARMETQLALTELTRRLVNPRLVTDPPPYRQHPFLRGPRHLPIAFDGIVPA